MLGTGLTILGMKMCNDLDIIDIWVKKIKSQIQKGQYPGVKFWVCLSSQVPHV